MQSRKDRNLYSCSSSMHCSCSSIALQSYLKCRLIIALLNQGGYVDDDVDAIVTENDEDSEENEDEAPSRELVTLC